MSKIFLTGMTASQSSPSANRKSLAFAGVIESVLTAKGHDVTWADPSVETTKEQLEQFDVVLVGIAPITSMSANRVYGALSIIDLMWTSPKLTIFVDTPNASQLSVSFNAMLNKPENFTKSFYSYRKEYKLVSESSELSSRLLKIISWLNESQWPNTIYPALPWKLDRDSLKLPKQALASVTPVNLDSFILSEPSVDDSIRREKWLIDHNTDWTKKVLGNSSFPTFPMKWNKGNTDVDVYEQMLRASGVVISNHKKDGTWWSYRYIQALNSGTPIVTDWQESQTLGKEWSVLASTVESMPQGARNLIAKAQWDLYKNRIMPRTKAYEALKYVLRLSEG